MNRATVTQISDQSMVDNYKVLRNTYILLSMTLTFSTISAILSTLLHLPMPGALVTLITFYGLMFLTQRFSDSLLGIVSVFLLTGFVGYTLGPLFNFIFSHGMGSIVILALGGTTTVFLCCSAYVLATKREMSFLSGMLLAGSVMIFTSILSNTLLHISALALTVDLMFILFSSGTILWEISNIIYGGERNYIRATVNLYVSLYNLLISVLSLGLISRSKNEQSHLR